MGPITEATLQEWVDEADDDMRAWTVFCADAAYRFDGVCLHAIDATSRRQHTLRLERRRPHARRRRARGRLEAVLRARAPRRRCVDERWRTSTSSMRRVPFTQVRRADGVFQLYVELPYHHYLEIDSLTFRGTVGTPSARAWADVV